MFRRRGRPDSTPGAARQPPPASPGDAVAAARAQLAITPVVGDPGAVEAGLAEALALDPELELPRVLAALAHLDAAVLTGVVWNEPDRYRGLFDPFWWQPGAAEHARNGQSGWRVEVTDRTSPVVGVVEVTAVRVATQIQSTYARRVVDQHGNLIEGDTAPRPHVDRIEAMRSEPVRTRRPGGTLDGRCPACDASIMVTAAGGCVACGVPLPDPALDWVVMWREPVA